MKITMLMCLAVLAYAVPAVAQDRIELYTDMNRTQCALSEQVDPPFVQIHVWLTGPIKATGARFAIPVPACWVGATPVGFTLNPAHLAIGSFQTDWSLGFFAGSGACIAAHTPPIYVGAVNFVVSGQALPCCEVKPGPGVEYVFTDCSFGEYPLVNGGQHVFVNANASCPCMSPVAAEPSTWGRVKSLYR
jgi:hypothetical protein